MAGYKRKLKLKLFEEAQGRCEYCGEEMILTDGDWKKQKCTPPLNAATIDHKYCKNHPLRRVKTKGRRTFIVCWKCNNEKAKIENKLYGKENIHC